MAEVWLNNQFVDEESGSVSLRDTGLLHGAGVFTTMRAYGGQVFRIADHLKRLRASCDALFVPLPQSDEVLMRAAAELLERSKLTDARCRLTVTRGAARHDPLHGLTLTPNVFLTASALEPYPADYYAKGLTVVLIDQYKLNPYDVQAGHKTLDYFSRLGALREANRRGAGEALWFNVHNYLQCGSITNVFVVKDGVIVTPPTAEDLHDADVAEVCPYPKSNVLPGITRKVVMELAANSGVAVKTAAIDVNGLLGADEAFVTNSIMGVMPVCRVERKAIGSDQPGVLTRTLMEQYAAAVEGRE